MSKYAQDDLRGVQMTSTEPSSPVAMENGHPVGANDIAKATEATTEEEVEEYSIPLTYSCAKETRVEDAERLESTDDLIFADTGSWFLNFVLVATGLLVKMLQCAVMAVLALFRDKVGLTDADDGSYSSTTGQVTDDLSQYYSSGSNDDSSKTITQGALFMAVFCSFYSASYLLGSLPSVYDEVLRRPFDVSRRILLVAVLDIILVALSAWSIVIMLSQATASMVDMLTGFLGIVVVLDLDDNVAAFMRVNVKKRVAAKPSYALAILIRTFYTVAFCGLFIGMLLNVKCIMCKVQVIALN